MEETANESAGRKQRLLYIFTPLLLLTVCLAMINLAPVLVTDTGNDRLSHTPTVTLTAATVAEGATVTMFDGSRQEPVATSTSSPTPAPELLPTMPPDVEIQLLGPPPGSVFRISDTLSFYWQWPIALEGDQSLAVYLLAGNQEHLLGRLAEPNLGKSYGLHVSVSDFAGSVGKVQWQVRLESSLAEEWLAVSEIRPLAFQLPAEAIP